jgi:hypothetical protein
MDRGVYHLSYFNYKPKCKHPTNCDMMADSHNSGARGARKWHGQHASAATIQELLKVVVFYAVLSKVINDQQLSQS